MKEDVKAETKAEEEVVTEAEEDVETEAEEEATPEEAAKPEEDVNPMLKIVVNFRDNVAMVGIGKKGTDPILSRIEGTLPVVVKAIPSMVKKAEESWGKSPMYPKTDWKPPPPPAPPASRTTVPVRQSSQSRNPEQPALL